MLYNEQTPEEYEDMVRFFETGSTGNQEAASQEAASSATPTAPVEEKSFFSQLGSGIKHQFKERAVALHKTLGAMSSDADISRYAERQARAAFEEGKQLEKEMGTVGEIASAATGIGMDIGTAFIPGGVGARAASTVASNTFGTTSEIINQQMKQQEQDPNAQVDVGSAWKHGLGSGVINAGLGFVVPGGKLPTRLAAGGMIGSGGAMVDQAAVNLATGNDVADNMLMAGTIGGVLGVGGSAALDKLYQGSKRQSDDPSAVNAGGKNAIHRMSSWFSSQPNIKQEAIDDYIATANINSKYQDLYNDPDLDPERAANLASKQVFDSMETGTMAAAMNAAKAIEEALGGAHRGLHNVELQAVDGSSLGRYGDNVGVPYKTSSKAGVIKTSAKPSLFRTTEAQRERETNASFDLAAQKDGKELVGKFEANFNNVKSIIHDAKLLANANGLDTSELSEMETAVQKLINLGGEWASGNAVSSVAIGNNADFLMRGLVNQRLINHPKLRSSLDPKTPFNPIQELLEWRTTDRMLTEIAPNWRHGSSDASKEGGSSGGGRLPIPSAEAVLAQEAAFRFGMPFVDILKQKAFRKEKAKTSDIMQQQRDLLDSRVLAQQPRKPTAKQKIGEDLVNGNLAGAADNAVVDMVEKGHQVDTAPVTSVVTGEPVSVSAADAPITAPTPAPVVSRSGNLSGSVARPRSPDDIKAAVAKADEMQQQAAIAKQQAEDIQTRADEVRTMAKQMGKPDNDPQIIDVQRSADEAAANAIQAQQEADILRSHARSLSKPQSSIPNSPQVLAENRKQTTNFAEEIRQQNLAKEQAALDEEAAVLRKAAKDSTTGLVAQPTPRAIEEVIEEDIIPTPVVEEDVIVEPVPRTDATKMVPKTKKEDPQPEPEPEVVIPGTDSKGMQGQPKPKPKPEPEAPEKTPEPVEEEVDTSAKVEEDKPVESISETPKVVSSELAKKISELKDEVQASDSNLRLSTPEFYKIQAKKKEIKDLEDKESTIRRIANQKKVDESLVNEAFESLTKEQQGLKGGEFTSFLNRAVDDLKAKKLESGGKKGGALAEKVNKGMEKSSEQARFDAEKAEQDAIDNKHKSLKEFAEGEGFKTDVKKFLKDRGILEGEDFNLRSMRVEMLKENAPVVSKNVKTVHTPEEASSKLADLSDDSDEVNKYIDDLVKSYKVSGKEISANEMFRMYNDVSKFAKKKAQNDLEKAQAELQDAEEEMERLQAALSSTRTSDVVNEASLISLNRMMRNAKKEADDKSGKVTRTQEYLAQVSKDKSDDMRKQSEAAEAEAKATEEYNRKVAIEEANMQTVSEQVERVKNTLEELQVDDDFIKNFLLANTSNTYKPFDEQRLVAKGFQQWSKTQKTQNDRSNKIANDVLKDVSKLSETELEGALNEILKKTNYMETNIGNMETISKVLGGVLEKAGVPVSDDAKMAVNIANAFNNALSKGIEMKKQFPRSPHLWVSRDLYYKISEAFDKEGEKPTSYAAGLLTNLRSLMYSSVHRTAAGKRLIEDGPILNTAQIEDEAKKLLSRRAKRTVDPDVVVK